MVHIRNDISREIKAIIYVIMHAMSYKTFMYNICSHLYKLTVCPNDKR